MTGRCLRRFAVVAGACVASPVLAASPALAASTVTYSASTTTTLSITGEANDDLVDVSLADNTITISDTGTGGITTTDPDCGTSGAAVTCPYDPPDPAPPANPTAPVTSAGAVLLGANDSFSTTAPFMVTLIGGEGDDTLGGGPRNDVLIGTSGNDTLLGGGGDDVLFGGGSGFSTGGTDLVDGQDGVDRTGFDGRLAGVNVSLDGQPNDGFPGEGDNAIVERVTGGDADDVLTGNAQGNTLDGGEGNDLLTGLEGNDTLIGDDGDDGLVGGPQRDGFQCDEGFDTGAVDASDVLDIGCERTGAEAVGGTARVNRKGRAKLPVACPAEEANPCGGRVVVMAGTKQIGSGRFEVGAGATGRADVKLTGPGRKLLSRSGGSLLALAQAQTTEPIGTSVKQDEVLLKTKRGGK